MPTTVTTSNETKTPKSEDGYSMGQSSTDKVGFYGTAPSVKAVGYSALTDSSGGTAAAGTGIQALSATYNSALIVNGISTLAAAINGINSALKAKGIIA